MTKPLEYKGYFGQVEFDPEANILHGEVAGTRDVITFQADSVADLIRSFHESVDDYLDFCAERGEEPDKPFSGQFVTRLEPEVHRLVSLAASTAGMSLNAWVARQLETAASSALGIVVPKRPQPKPRTKTRSPNVAPAKSSKAPRKRKKTAEQIS
jgi:predicted HicB family RNase H-like nuclease